MYTSVFDVMRGRDAQFTKASGIAWRVAAELGADASWKHIMGVLATTGDTFQPTALWAARARSVLSGATTPHDLDHPRGLDDERREW